MEDRVDGSDKPELLGLVLAGGRSRRMGRDKGSLSYARTGKPQVTVAVDLLLQVCARAFVSINVEQQDEAPYASLPVIVDTDPERGPAGGLLSAFRREPAAAWLVLAVDMPDVSVNLLRNLVRQRARDRIATVHRHGDGTIEPLCAIWEPTAAALVEQELEHGRGSLRAVARSAEAAVAQLPEPERLKSINTPEQRATVMRRADASSADSEPPSRDTDTSGRW